METPNVPKALEDCKINQVAIDPFTTSYFVSRETLISGANNTNKSHQMAIWRKKLFALMSRNAGSVVSYFNIPSNGVIELGSRVNV